MLIKPNKTPITATVIEDALPSQPFRIVILSIPGKPVLPKFLWAGRIVQVDRIHDSAIMTFKSGTVVSAMIEVMGDPFTQRFHLHSIEILDTEE